MKTQGTQTVKTSADDSPEDEPDHMLSQWLHESSGEGEPDSETMEILSHVCWEVFEEIKPTTHTSSEELMIEIKDTFGASLNRYKSRTSLRAIVKNVLRRAEKEITDETHLGEM